MVISIATLVYQRVILGSEVGSYFVFVVPDFGHSNGPGILSEGGFDVAGARRLVASDVTLNAVTTAAQQGNKLLGPDDGDVHVS